LSKTREQFVCLGKTVDGPGPLAKQAFINGINKGRGGKVKQVCFNFALFLLKGTVKEN